MTKRFLSNEELKKYICGAVYFDENDGLIPYRFTKEKLDAATDPARKIRQSTGTGIKIEFYSDTEELSFNYTAFIKFVSGIYKLYFFDVYADDVLVLHQGEKDVDEDRRGTVNVKFKAGNKRITIYLPGSCAVNITDFAISDGAEISPVSYNGKTLFLGDSITHAAYVDFPSFTYANRVTKKLGCYTVNEAIGGDVFSVHHLENLPDIDFDTVFIAYGTNDWKWANASSPERIKAFFEKNRNIRDKLLMVVILGHALIDFDMEFLAITLPLFMTLEFDKKFEIRNIQMTNIVLGTVFICYSFFTLVTMCNKFQKYDLSNKLFAYSIALNDELELDFESDDYDTIGGYCLQLLHSNRLSYPLPGHKYFYSPRQVSIR